MTESTIHSQLEKFLHDQGTGQYSHLLAHLVVALVILLIGTFSGGVSRLILRRLVRPLLGRRTSWIEPLTRRHVLFRLSRFALPLVVYCSIPLLFADRPDVATMMYRAVAIWSLFVGALVVEALVNVAADLCVQFPSLRHSPIRSYAQVVKLVVWVTFALLALTKLIDQSVTAVLAGLGAATAVLLLIFKDSILGLVASIQIAALDMVRVGDWIQMDKYGANGDVVDISLTTVKVRNFDKTIVTIPAYCLVSEPVVNWRGMTEAGGRRIKRSLRIDQDAIHFADEALLERCRRMELLDEYLSAKEEELELWNQTRRKEDHPVNARRLTNIGLYRAYVSAYLRSHEHIHASGLTFLVRLLEPTEVGLPLQIYVFTKTTVWAEYEAIQSDIFDHLLAVLPEFDLKIYQCT
ncbi:Miniconductance mechanosensitive channel YbdG [Planctomycetes bacterium Pan216]|uniref:Miniconductance mechanosensitive channel YbdG n=2 Tax=Kolteria novifilia TaxID=2527975 RepID=A0A518B674_9BACT|nr:Miniconductance mechanosensitive channel YbdG [Planctomycetes bacterium Pan216]